MLDYHDWHFLNDSFLPNIAEQLFNIPFSLQLPPLSLCEYGCIRRHLSLPNMLSFFLFLLPFYNRVQEDLHLELNVSVIALLGFIIPV